MAILSRMSWSEVCGAGAAICSAVREMWGDGDDGVFGVVLAEGFCVCDMSRSSNPCEIANLGCEEVCPLGGVISLSECIQLASLKLTFKIINLRLKFLFPGSMVSQSGHDPEIVLSFIGPICLVLLKGRQEGCEVDAG